MILVFIIISLTSVFLLYKNIVLEKRVSLLEIGLPIPKDITFVGKIPDRLELSNIDNNYSVLDDIFDSMHMEGWVVNILQDQVLTYVQSYMIEFNNPSNTISVKARFYINESRDRDKHHTADIGFLLVINSNPHSVLSYDKDKISEEIILYLFECVVDYHNNINNDLKESYIDTLNHIKSNLKALNRSRKLDQII